MMNRNMIATGGVFDIIHADHINLFKKMKRYDNKNRFSFFHVNVFLNSDESVMLNRGKPPLVSESQRMAVLESISWVNAVFIFDEKHPHEIIERFKPAVWCKGGDYDIEKMQSTPIVRAYGGEVINIPHLCGIHSSDIIKKAIKARPVDCSDLWVYVVYANNGDAKDRIVDVFTDELAAFELVKRNEKEFPRTGWDYKTMDVTE